MNYAGPIVQCYATGRVTGKENIGGLVGRNWGTIAATYATGSVSGRHVTGGLIGANEGTLISSYATGRIRGVFLSGGLVGANGGTTFGSYSTGRVTGDRAVGGLIGSNDGPIIDSYWDTDKSRTFVGVGTDDRNADGTSARATTRPGLAAQQDADQEHCSRLRTIRGSISTGTWIPTTLMATITKTQAKKTTGTSVLRGIIRT